MTLKKLLSGIIKGTAYGFTAMMMVFAIISLFFGQGGISVYFILQIWFVAIVCAVLQGLFFTNIIIKKMHYTFRVILFSVPFLLFLVAVAYFCRWFPVENIISWAIFFASFIFCFVFMIVFFEIYFKITGKKYDGLLNEYKRKKKLNEKK